VLRHRVLARVSATVFAAALLAAGCSGSSTKNTAVQTPASAGPTPTTQPRAIGLRSNVDESAESIPDKPLSAATRAKLAAQLVVARSVAMRYPTVKDATSAGYIQAGLFTPGAGAHYVSLSVGAAGYSHQTTAVDASKPLALIYDGIGPNSHITGLMYGSFELNPPEGFAGPNDHWHRHTNLCIRYNDHGKISVPFPPDSDVTQAQCDAVQGQFMRNTLWMVHAWVVPGWESPQGVFSHANIDLHCGDGTDHVDSVGFCKGTE
jgi:hypothetical protein